MLSGTAKFWIGVFLGVAGTATSNGQLYVLDGVGTNGWDDTGLVGLVWTPSPSSNVAGYTVLWGYTSNTWVQALDVGDVTSVTLGGLLTNTCYHFAVAAYSVSGLESDASPEIIYCVGESAEVPSQPPPEGFFLAATVISFSGSDGAHPYASLVQASDGSFLGTTAFGGQVAIGVPDGGGTIFRLTPQGTLTTLRALVAFNGVTPYAELVLGSDGNYYGTTSAGGSGGVGTAFQMTPAGGLAWAFLTTPVGANSKAALIENGDASYYGTTSAGGPSGVGTIFRGTRAGVITTLAAFNNSNGANPQGSLCRGTDGSYYGTTLNGGANGLGTIFRLSPSGTLTTVHSFTGAADGARPRGGLLPVAGGFLYGTTSEGGTNGRGVIYRISQAGALTSLHSFTGGTNSASPCAEPMRATDGNIYGTTTSGGYVTNGFPDGCGTVFRLSTNGVVRTVHAFRGGRDGATPWAGLVQGADGSFYGTTVYGGALNKGTVFRLTYVSPPTAQLVTRTAGMLRINWRVTPQINYQVQASGTLSQGTWQNEATPIRASGTELTTSHPIGTESRRFYRLQAQP